ncbi:MAG: DNA-formamidopyrimidine glycosylase, partial [Chloroflexota bacterium]|nr:DNA-formamidopyrimidine glycosylase [Chloroflexota bacterium]
MPELPEVETIRRELVSYIVGRNVRRATVLDPKLTLDLPLQEFEFRLIGQRVEGVDRRGKYLLLRFTDRILVLHLMMSGRVHLR